MGVEEFRMPERPPEPVAVGWLWETPGASQDPHLCAGPSGHPPSLMERHLGTPHARGRGR